MLPMHARSDAFEAKREEARQLGAEAEERANLADRLEEQAEWSYFKPSCCGSGVGSVKWKVLPSPSLLSAQILPPCASTMHREM